MPKIHDPVFSIFHPAERLNMIPVFRSSLFTDSQIPWHRLRHELSRHGGQKKARSHYPQPIRSINTVSVPPLFDVNRYFKPLWKPSHLLDTNLKSCGNCLRPTAQILLRAKPTRAFMNNQEPDLNPTPAETDSAKTNESVQRERSELPVDQRSSYLRSRQIALKKFSPQGGDPS